MVPNIYTQLSVHSGEQKIKNKMKQKNYDTNDHI